MKPNKVIAPSAFGEWIDMAFAINSFRLKMLILVAKSLFRPPPLTLALSPRWGER